MKNDGFSKYIAGKEMSDEELLKMTGGETFASVSAKPFDPKPVPLYGVQPKYGVQPLYGIQPKYGVQPLYGVKPLYGIEPVK